MTRLPTALLLAALLVGLGSLSAPALAHSYADPALRSVLDGVQPAILPPTVVVAVVPSVVDQLVVTNPTPDPLEVEGVGGEPFLRIDRSGVLANLASPDWYATGSPEGGIAPPPDVQRDRGSGKPHWALVSHGSTWAEFDPRLHPPVAATPAQRSAGKDVVLTTWAIPLRYAGRRLAATGHVLFSPVRGALQVAVLQVPPGLTATPLQGELPGLFVRSGRLPVVVGGRDGRPFLRFQGGTVSANTASASWVDDQRAKGRPVTPTGRGTQWVPVAQGSTYSWLDGRLRYPRDLPAAEVLARHGPTVVQSWSIPVAIDGSPAELRGTVSWVPRALATAAAPAGRPWLPWVLGAAVLLGAATWLRRRTRGGPA